MPPKPTCTSAASRADRHEALSVLRYESRSDASHLWLRRQFSEFSVLESRNLNSEKSTRKLVELQMALGSGYLVQH